MRYKYGRSIGSQKDSIHRFYIQARSCYCRSTRNQGSQGYFQCRIPHFCNPRLLCTQDRCTRCSSRSCQPGSRHLCCSRTGEVDLVPHRLACSVDTTGYQSSLVYTVAHHTIRMLCMDRFQRRRCLADNCCPGCHSLQALEYIDESLDRKSETLVKLKDARHDSLYDESVKIFEKYFQ